MCSATPARSGRPDGIYADGTFPMRGGKLSPLWRPTRTLAGEHESGALPTEFRASSLGGFNKTAVGAPIVAAVRIDRDHGCRLGGPPQEQVYDGVDGTICPDALRLAGNTLAWGRLAASRSGSRGLARSARRCGSRA